MNRMFIYHVDPAHGWLEVYLSELEDLGIRNKISSCSYRKRAIAMLEENSDMPIFISAYRKKFGCDPWIFEQYSENKSFVRSWQPYY